jgi:hypothetical protein
MVSLKSHRSSSLAKVCLILICSLGLITISFFNAPETILDAGKVSLKVSWISSLAALLQQGQISGRDFHFTYGLLSQVIAWLGTIVQGSGSPLIAYPYIIIFLEATSIILIAIIILLLFRYVDALQIFIIYLGIGILQLVDFASFRPFFMVLASVILHKAIFSRTSIWRIFWAVIAGLVCVTAQLASVDLGILAFLSMVATGCCYVAYDLFHSCRKVNFLPKGTIWALLSAISIYVGVNLAIDVVFKLTSPNYQFLFDYQKYAFEIIRGYNLTMGSSWGLSTLPTAGLFLIVTLTMLMTIRNVLASCTEESFLFFGLMVFAVAQFKSVTVRSDDIHIIRGALPFFFLFLISANQWWIKGKFAKVAWCALFVILVVTRINTSTFQTTTFPRVISGELTPTIKLQAINSITADPNVILPSSLRSELQNTPGPLLTFPFENYIAISAHKQLIAPTVLAHNAHTEALQSMYIRSLDSFIPTVKVVYAIDELGTHLIDGVQHVTRLPMIFEYIYSNFNLDLNSPRNTGFYLLNARQQKRQFASKSIAFRQSDWYNFHTTVQPDKPVNCGLMRFSLTIEYPLTTIIGRPDPLRLNFMHQGSSVYKTNLVALQTGQTFYTYVGTFPPEQFSDVLGDGENIQGETWDSLVITPNSTGFLEVSPNRVKLNKLECIILSK